MQKTNKSNLKKALSVALSAILIVLLALYIIQNRQDMARLLQLDGGTVALLLLFGLCACVMNCIYHRIILSTFNVQLDLVDWMGVVMVSNVIAFVLPLRADLIFSAAYYKKVKGLAYTRSVSIAAGNVVFSLVFALLETAIALVCYGLIDGKWPAMLWLLLVVGVAGVTAFLVIALALGDHQPEFVRKHRIIREMVEGFIQLLKDRKMLSELLCCLIANHCFHFLLYMVCFHAIGMEITFYQALLYSSMSKLSSILTIVPGNIGIKEAVMGFTTGTMGDLFQSGVMVSLLHRVTLMIVYLVAGAAFAWPVIRKMKQAQPLPAPEDAHE